MFQGCQVFPKFPNNEVTIYGVVQYTFAHYFLLHRTVTTQGYSSLNNNLGPCTTTMYLQDKTNHHDSI
jgi:hypothetical protein